LGLHAPTVNIPWNSNSTVDASGNSAVRTIRFSILAKTGNLYPGSPSVPTAIEDRTAWSSAATDPSGPRFRLLRDVVSPRAWNLYN
jgi:hypothetical protein